MATSLITTRTVCGVTAAMADGVVYALTPCCGASAKGSAHGVVCRACYAPIPSVYGADLLGVLEHAGCPRPRECEMYTIGVLAQNEEARA